MLCMASLLQGAIIIVGVVGLLDYPEFIYLWKTNKMDWVVWNVAFLFTTFLVRAALFYFFLPASFLQAACGAQSGAL